MWDRSTSPTPPRAGSCSSKKPAKIRRSVSMALAVEWPHGHAHLGHVGHHGGRQLRCGGMDGPPARRHVVRVDIGDGADRFARPHRAARRAWACTTYSNTRSPTSGGVLQGAGEGRSYQPLDMAAAGPLTDGHSGASLARRVLCGDQPSSRTLPIRALLHKTAERRKEVVTACAAVGRRAGALPPHSWSLRKLRYNDSFPRRKGDPPRFALTGLVRHDHRLYP